MKIIIAVLCIIFFVSTANAGPIYRCTDKDGSTLTTNIPQDGMKCVNKDGDGSVQDQRSGEMLQKDDGGGTLVLDNRQWQRNRLRQVNKQARERKQQQEEEIE